MKPPSGPLFTIAWKGVTLGPFTVGQVREKLANGEVSRMHQVEVEGRWLSVDEFLARQEPVEREPVRKLSEKERVFLTDAKLLESEPSSAAVPPDSTGEAPRTSRLAIAAALCAFGNFVPYLNFVAWIFALIFGSLALRETERRPGLRGRGLAIAALVVTGFLLIVAITFLVLMALDGQIKF
jgi:hypothetical protein